VESRRDIGLVSLGHGHLQWLGLGPSRCFQHLGGPTYLCYP
jgi:hypothetical protein